MNKDNSVLNPVEFFLYLAFLKYIFYFLGGQETRYMGVFFPFVHLQNGLIEFLSCL